MRYIIGLGNQLRAEDAFGLDVIAKLEPLDLKDTICLSVVQLTPEFVLDLIDANEIIFIDACYSLDNNYALACPLSEEKLLGLSHHISYQVLMSMLFHLYNVKPKLQVYSMLTKNFESFKNSVKYKENVQQVVNHLLFK